MFKKGLATFAGVIALGIGFVSVAEAAFIQTLSKNQTSTGQLLTYDFNGLSPSDGTDGFITIASGPGSTFDLSTTSSEYFDLALDGMSAGRYACDTTPSNAILMACDGVNSQDTFSHVLSFSGLLSDFGIDVASKIADGLLQVAVDFGSGVNPGFGSNNPNQLAVTLDYNEASSVPEPVTLALMGLGLLGLGVSRRRKLVT